MAKSRLPTELNRMDWQVLLIIQDKWDNLKKAPTYRDLYAEMFQAPHYRTRSRLAVEHAVDKLKESGLLKDQRTLELTTAGQAAIKRIGEFSKWPLRVEYQGHTIKWFDAVFYE